MLLVPARSRVFSAPASELVFYGFSTPDLPMTFALFVGGTVIAISAMLLLACRPAETVPPIRGDWQLATVPALCDAEELLDRLENWGFEERELIVLGNACFAVRWR